MNPTTGEIAVSLEEHQRRIDKAEDVISETRKSITGVERMIAAMNASVVERMGGVDSRLKKIEDAFQWGRRLAFAVVLGVGGLVGTKIWELITRHAP